jgi:hypothetical protein
MTTWLKTWTPADVQNANDFAEYCQQYLGCPWPTYKDKAILKKKIDDLFRKYPEMDYYSLCRIVAWMRSKKKRPARVWMVVESFRDAWSAGALPELDPAERKDKTLEQKIEAALEQEERPEWRRRLMGSKGDARKEVYEAWEMDSLTSSDSR